MLGRRGKRRGFGGNVKFRLFFSKVGGKERERVEEGCFRGRG